MKLGVDFGTNRIVVAAADRGNYPLVSFEAPDGASPDWYPSLVAIPAVTNGCMDGMPTIDRATKPGLSFAQLNASWKARARKLSSIWVIKS